MTAWPRFDHRADCPAPDLLYEFTGRLGDPMVACRGCLRSTPAHRVTEPEPVGQGRYRLDCVRCEAAIHLRRPEPRVPVCAKCREVGP